MQQIVDLQKSKSSDSLDEITAAITAINAAKAIADKTRRDDNSLWRLVLYALCAGIILVLTSVFIPDFVEKDDSEGKFLSSCVVGLVGTIVFIIQRLSENKKEINLAEHVLIVCDAAKRIKNKIEEFQNTITELRKSTETIKENYESERNSLRKDLSFLKKKNESIDKAIDVLSEFLRNKVMLKINAEIKMNESGKIIYSTELSPGQIYKDIHLLCKYISEVASTIIGHSVRCGVIIQEPRKNNRFVPIVVYNPGDPKYKSPHKFKKGSLFSEHLINNYRMECHSPIHKQFTTVIIPNVEEHIQLRKDPIFELQAGQNRYMKSLAGIVVYFRPNDGDTIILGAVNIDCAVVGAITEERFKEFSHYLRIAYRLIAEKLIIINKDENIYNALQNTKKALLKKNANDRS